MPKIPIGIIGGTGYTGIELIRLLAVHPHAEIKAVTSRQAMGKKIGEILPAFAHLPHVFEDLDVSSISKKVKAVFLCLPHHEAMNVAKPFRDAGVTVFDLSADFRLKDKTEYESWYGPHSQPELLKEAVYGLPEIHREEIKGKSLIACPGCYPTSIILGLAPLLKNKLIDPATIICDSKSGVSGAGRSAQVGTLYSEVNDSFKAYKIGNHRHTPEIEQELAALCGKKATVLFSPHLVPMDRGILSTIYANPVKKEKTAELLKLYRSFYEKEPFIQILPEGEFPQTKHVRGSNMVHISVLQDERTGKIVVVSAIDNLTKGASGQAVQCFNIIYGLPETIGLLNAGLIP